VEVPSAELRPAAFEGPDEDRDERDDGMHSMDRVLAVLGASPAALDDIVRGCGLPASAVRATLLELELDGRITRMGGDLVQLLR
jgi:DNA processing protein